MSYLIGEDLQRLDELWEIHKRNSDRRVRQIEALGTERSGFEWREYREGLAAALQMLEDDEARKRLQAAYDDWHASQGAWGSELERLKRLETERALPEARQVLAEAGGWLSYSMLNQSMKGRRYQLDLSVFGGSPHFEVVRRGSGHRIVLPELGDKAA